MQNSIKLLKRIKKLSESNNNILPTNLSEFGDEKKVKAFCKQLHESGLITCISVPSTDYEDDGEWLDVCDIALSSSGEVLISTSENQNQ